MEIIIVGMGQFGSALAQHFSKNGFIVHTVDQLTPWPVTSSKKFAVLLCVPTQNLPEVLAQRATELSKAPFIISACKGLLQDSLLTPSQYLLKTLKTSKVIAVLSGPSFAHEIEKNLPAALVISSRKQKDADFLCKKLSSGNLRFYSNSDPVGVEYCGALKNVYALLAGACDGLNLGENARASLNTRALAELWRFVKTLGGKQMTVFGLAGAGDLFLTCSSSQSRNFRFGRGLAAGKKPAQLIQELGTVEGYWTAFVAAKLSRKKKARTPLIQTAVDILESKLSFEQAFKKLISRKTRGEFE